MRYGACSFLFIFAVCVGAGLCRAAETNELTVPAPAYYKQATFQVPRKITVTYKIKSGDTLLGLGRRFHTSAGEIKKANSLRTDTIIIGRTLKIPTYKMEPIQFSLQEILSDTDIYSETESADPRLLQLVRLAKEYEGIPYKWGGESPYRVDCSGFVKLIFKCFGVVLPHSSRDQFKAGQDVQNIIIGDLLFFATRGANRINHVGIYIGNGKFIHASSKNKKVIISSLDSSYYKNRFRGARRVWDGSGYEQACLKQF